MPLPRTVTASLRAWRTMFGHNTAAENWIKEKYLKRIDTRVEIDRGPGWVQLSGKTSVIVSESDDFPEPRRGIFLKGGCDLPSAFTVAPLLRQGIKGTIAISRPAGGTGGNRSDQILQTLESLDAEAVEETSRVLGLRRDFFEPTFFDPTFRVPRMSEAGEFRKDLVVMGISTDQTRQLYRHREHGFIVDPGGWWLNQDLNLVLQDLDKVEWFRKNFKQVGRMTVDEFVKNNTRLIEEIRQRTGAQVIFYNTLTVDPSNPTHNYQLVRTDHGARRRDFTIALARLSADLDFPVVDVDRILKTEGVEEQVDFAHFPVDRMMPIGADLYQILVDMEFV